MIAEVDRILKIRSTQWLVVVAMIAELAALIKQHVAIIAVIGNDRVSLHLSIRFIIIILDDETCERDTVLPAELCDIRPPDLGIKFWDIHLIIAFYILTIAHRDR